MRKERIEKLVDDAIKSFDAAKKAEPKPFLLTRVMAAINNQSASQNVWTKAAVFISRPGIAIAGLLLIILVNTTIIMVNKSDSEQPGTAQNNFATKDDFAINANSIYYIENPEQ
ncbi:MAG: hypothetical protein QM737_10775 [Ferruginibacter sp.]